MKKQYIAACAAALLTAVSMSQTAMADKAVTGTVRADALNVRSQPNTSSVILGQFPDGSTVTITEAKDNWYKIAYGTNSAYVCADYVIVAEAPNYVETFSQPSAAAGTVYADIPSYEGSSVTGEMLVEAAKQYIGTPYVYGGMSPNGFDCSGFVKYCYSLFGADVNRVAQDQARNGYEVPRESMRPGDLLCFVSSVGGSYIGHTGIYVGNGYFIHSPRVGYNVEIIPLTYGTYSQRLTHIRRIFD